MNTPAVIVLTDGVRRLAEPGSGSATVQSCAICVAEFSLLELPDDFCHRQGAANANAPWQPSWSHEPFMASWSGSKDACRACVFAEHDKEGLPSIVAAGRADVRCWHRLHVTTQQCSSPSAQVLCVFCDVVRSSAKWILASQQQRQQRGPVVFWGLPMAIMKA